MDPAVAATRGPEAPEGDDAGGREGTAKLFPDRTLVYISRSIGRPLFHILPSHARHFRHTVYVCPGEATDFDHWQGDNWQICTVDGRSRLLGGELGRYFGARRNAADLRGLIERQESPVVFLHFPSLFSLGLLPTLRAMDVPVIPFVAGDWNANLSADRPLLGALGLGRALDRRVRRALARFPLTVTSGNRLRDKYGDGRVHVWRGTTHNEVVQKSTQECRRLVFLGRLDENKRCCDVVDAVAILRERGIDDVELRVAGNGHQEEALRRQVRAAGLEGCVEFLGWVDDTEEVAALYDWADAAIVASLSEGTPKILPEGMSRGCAIIATPVGDVPEMIADGDNGLLVPVKSPRAIADAVVRLRDEPGLLARIREGSRRYAEEYRLDAEVDKLWAAVKAELLDR